MSRSDRPQNTASYVFSRSVLWQPNDDDGGAHHIKDQPYKIVIGGSPSSTLVVTDKELKQRFAVFLKQKIHDEVSDANDAGNSKHEKVKGTEFALFYAALLVTAFDPTSQPKSLSLRDHHDTITSLDDHFGEVAFNLIGPLLGLLKAWKRMETPAVSMDELGKTVNTGDNDDNSDRGSTTAKGKGKAEGSGASVASTTNIVTMDTKGRGTGDKTAQRVVPTWYGQRCVLSGLIQPQGAHIVPVRALRYNEASLFWRMARSFWPLSDSTEDELVVRGREVTNIVPLCPDGHLLWDRYCFALRPITHPDPHRMYVQIVWLTDVDTDGGLVASRWNHDVGGSIVDFRRGQPRYSSDGSRGNDGNWYPPIRHGDVYELTTADPVAQPLPSFRLLEIQFAVHKLISGMCAAGAVRTIFGGDPPDDTSPPVPAGLQLPPMWRAALDAAVDAGVLNTAASDRWEKAVIQHHYRLLDSQGDGDDSEGSIIA